MKKTITIEESTYRRLEGHAKTFETEDAVICRALDALDAQGARTAAGGLAGDGPSMPDDVSLLDSQRLPSFKHAKLEQACIEEGEWLPRLTWNSLRDRLLTAVIKRAPPGGATAVLGRLSVNFVGGEKTDEGFNYLPDIDISVQNQDADRACQAVAHLAEEYGIPVDMVIFWRDKEGAAFPGQRRRLRLPCRK